MNRKIALVFVMMVLASCTTYVCTDGSRVADASSCNQMTEQADFTFESFSISGNVCDIEFERKYQMLYDKYSCSVKQTTNTGGFNVEEQRIINKWDVSCSCKYSSRS